MFNRELFYSLCDKYDVEMSDSFDRFMIKEGGIVRPLVEDDVWRVFSNFKSFFSYSVCSTGAKNVKDVYNTVDELPIAC